MELLFVVDTTRLLVAAPLFLNKQPVVSRDLTCKTFMVTVNTCIVLLYTLYSYSLDKELTDKYTTNPDLLTDALIGCWLVHGASALHHNLAMQALTFPQLLHQLRIKETVPVPSGKGNTANVNSHGGSGRT